MRQTIVVVAGIVLLTLSACSDFLSVPPETSVTPDNFFETQTDFEQAVAGAYAPLQNLYDSPGGWAMAEMRSDNTHFIFHPGQRAAQGTEAMSTFLVESTGPVGGRWNNNYSTIARANEILANIDEANFDQAAKDNLRGQALFLRAFAYFGLVRYYGAVPLHLEPSTSYEGTFLPSSPVSEVYDQIIADAQEAAGLLPSQASPGQATSGAAYTLLADVYLNLERWADVESALANVTGYSLLSDYADVFEPANEGNAEMIFEIQYIEGAAQALYSFFPYRFLPKLDDPSVITGVTPARFNLQGSMNIPTPDLIAAYDTVRDERYDASIGFYTGPSPIANHSYDHTPYIKKYQHAHALYGQTGQNWPVYRYAEVLLMRAEALNEQGQSAAALGPLNEVRARAGLDAVTTTDQAALRDIILHERRIELAFENKRWIDLVRTGRAVEVMNAFGARVKANPRAYYYPEGTAPLGASFNVTENKLVYPIPARELRVNPELEQNPGY